MSTRRLLRSAAIAAGAAAVIAGLQASPAAAQVFWDWGGGSVVGDSGRKIVHFSPQFDRGQVVVSFGDRRLYFVTKPGQAISYPIAIPREEDRWEGVATVSDKKVNPSWTPTPTMLAENPRLPRWVPGGHPMNPLGVRAFYLGSSAYRIHGTDAPWTIGTSVSKGCIRMYNQDVLDLYPRVSVGAMVMVTWRRFSTSQDADALLARERVAKEATERNADAQLWDCQPTPPTGQVVCFPQEKKPASGEVMAPAAQSANTKAPEPTKKQSQEGNANAQLWDCQPRPSTGQIVCSPIIGSW